MKILKQDIFYSLEIIYNSTVFTDAKSAGNVMLVNICPTGAPQKTLDTAMTLMLLSKTIAKVIWRPLIPKIIGKIPMEPIKPESLLKNHSSMIILLF